MPPFVLREPINVLTHALGLVTAFPTTWFLIRAVMKRRARGTADFCFETGKLVSLAVFGFGMASCYGASTLYHAIPGDERTLDLLRRWDMVGIFLLIAGTFTPSAWALMRPRPRLVAMVVVWGCSVVCGAAVALGRSFPSWLATSIYLALGWGMVLCYADIRRYYSRRTLRLLPIGGILYSLGAAVNLTHAPGSHEVFHLFVLAGTAAHTRFLFRVVVPASEPTSRRASGGPMSERPARRPAEVDV